jgi:two-component system chemotaxis response regulator CheB
VTGKIRTLVVDDSAVMRQLLRTLLAEDAAIEIVGTAPDASIAWEKIQQLKPDVVTLDIEMPRMDGLSFLQQLMREAPLPVVMVSSLTESGSAVTLRALEMGAVDFVTKPTSDALAEFAHAVSDKIRMAHTARIRRPSAIPDARAALPINKGQAKRAPQPTGKIVAIGASTGGTEAIKEILMDLPADCAPALVVQHMPARFTRPFADRLNGICPPEVKEAADGDRIERGRVLIAPGDFHMRLARTDAGLVVRLDQGDPVNRHRPSVDVLFQSCSLVAGANAIGVLLTGMGDDGARGLGEMRQAGARTLAQDESTSVIFGMPKAAIDLGAAEQVLPLERMAEAITRLSIESSLMATRFSASD